MTYDTQEPATGRASYSPSADGEARPPVVEQAQDCAAAHSAVTPATKSGG